MIINPINRVNGELRTPPDKSISHRAIILSSISNGNNKISNFLFSKDTYMTLNAMRKLGINIETNSAAKEVYVQGKGLYDLRPANRIYCGNSATTMRLLAGLLSGQKFSSYLFGDDSLNRRPMERIKKPLTLMGANINLTDGHAPIFIRPSNLEAINYHMQIPSAQVKSSILLASLYTKGITKIQEPILTRNHTEIMLEYLNCNISSKENEIQITNPNTLISKDIFVPGDISSAAYFIALALITDESSLIIRDVGVNKTRTHILELWKKMGGKIEIINKRNFNGEDVSDIVVKSSKLKGIVLSEEDVSLCIDEIPILAVTAAFAQGETKIYGAKELRVKESDRLYLTYTNLKNMKAHVEIDENNLSIVGGNEIFGSDIETQKDHRIAMAFTIASLRAVGSSVIKDYSSVQISYPNFYEDLNKIIEY